MRDPITDAAQDPSCLLCLTPDRGGSWWSRLRPAMPRDFSEGYRWDALQAAMYSSLPWTSDYHFTFDFTVADDFENGSYWIMYQSNGRISFALDKDARGCRFVFGSYSFNGGVFVYAPFASSLAGRHEVTLAVEGATLRVTVDGTVYEQSGERVESSAYNRVVTTSAPVTLHAVSLTDDSTGTAVWQAAYSDLYDTSNPWPSPVPRNFAEEPEAWTDAITAANGLGEDNWAFEIKLNLKSQITGAVFNNLAGSPLKLYDDLVSSGEASFFLRNYVDTAAWTGRHSIRLEVAGGNASLYLDSEFKAAKATGLTSVQFEQASTTSADVEIEAVEFVNLTTGRTVWRYPSDAERVRLITKTNVRTDRGAFEAADETERWKVSTPLRWGNLNAAIIIVQATIDDCPCSVFSFGMPANPNYSVILLRRSAENQLYASLLGTRTDGSSVYRTITVDFSPDAGRQYCFALVFDIDGDFMNLYVDGSLLSSIALRPLVAIAVDGQTLPGFAFGTASTSDAVNSGAAVSFALVFDRALSAAEIAALTPKQA